MHRRFLALVSLLTTTLLACSEAGPSGPSPAPTGEFSVAMTAYTPAAPGNCSAAIHNQFATIGPDGKLYPTWHPPVDPATGCSFGHEHGRDPRGSRLHAKVGDIPFGHANEMLDIHDPSGRRHEDHVGHKVEWENGVAFSAGDGLGGFFSITCDVLTKLHQGTHSRDAFTNNVHELAYHIACSDGTEMYVTLLTAIGKPGEFKRSCDGTIVQAGAPTPANSPAGGGQRKIPDRECILRHLLVPAGSNSNYHSALHESWETHSVIKRADGHTLASFDPYFQVFLPSRFFDAAAPLATARPMDACYEAEGNGDRARGGHCEQATASWSLTDLRFDDPRSPFNGVRRKVDINSNRINNLDGPNVWYTDPYGRNAQPTPFPGAVRQWIARINNSNAFNFNGPAIGADRQYGAPGTHAPN
jgi:hypothetical protein